MPRNGSGTYSLPQPPFVPGSTIASAAVNSDFTDVGAALTQSISKDGQTVYTSSQPMGGNKLTGLGVGTAQTDSVAISQVVGSVLDYAIDTGAADAYVIAPSPGITAYAVGQRFAFKAINANATTTPTLAVDGLTAGLIKSPDGTAPVIGAIVADMQCVVQVASVTTGTPVFHLETPTGRAITQAVGDNTTKGATTAFVAAALTAGFGGAALRSYLAGLTLSTAGSSATFGIAVGMATNSTNVVSLVLASAYTKTTSAWALGTAAGSLDTGSIANDTWYHVFLIQRPDTGVVDVLTSTSATAPTLPTNYTLFRRIGSIKTNGSAQWVSFLQVGDSFYIAPVADFTAGGTSVATLRTLASVPLGVVVEPMLTAQCNGGTPGISAIQIAPAANSALLKYALAAQWNDGDGGQVISDVVGVPTNTSAQIYVAIPNFVSTAVLSTVGWIDRRGRDA